MPAGMKNRMEKAQEMLVRMSAPTLRDDLDRRGRGPLTPLAVRVQVAATATIGEVLEAKRRLMAL